MAVGVVLRGQEVAWERHGAGIRDGTARGFSEVLGGLNAYELCRLDQAVEERGGSGSTLRATAVMILAAHGQCPHPALDVVGVCAVKGAFFARVRYPTGKLSLQPEALGAAQEVTNGLKHFEKRPPWEVSVPCGPQRAVNTEQAPKLPSRVPTRHTNGEGRCLG